MDATLIESPDETRAVVPGWAWLLLAGLILLTAAAGYWAGRRTPAWPGEGSVEVGFARDMITHHAQAVDMATLIRDRSHDEVVRQIALDMALTQQGQIGQMQAWLSVWGVPQASTGPAMVWMGHPVEGMMPGMATPEQLNHLRELEGTEADILFLQLMIEHHRSGVDMARAAVEMAGEPEVVRLARSMVEAQSYEIELMETLLAQKNASPMEMEDGSHAH